MINSLLTEQMHSLKTIKHNLGKRALEIANDISYLYYHLNEDISWISSKYYNIKNLISS